MNDPDYRNPLWAIAHVVAAEFGYELVEVMIRGRTRPVIRARHAVALAMRDRWALSYPELGRLFGKDQSTMRSAVLSARLWMKTDDDFAARMREVYRRDRPPAMRKAAAPGWPCEADVPVCTGQLGLGAAS